MRLFLGNLSFETTEDDIRELCEPYGSVRQIRLISDRETGRPRGFGFITMGSEADGLAAMECLDGMSFQGRTLKCNEARPRV